MGDGADDGRAEHDADVAHRHHPAERLRAAADVARGAEDDRDDRREARGRGARTRRGPPAPRRSPGRRSARGRRGCRRRGRPRPGRSAPRGGRPQKRAEHHSDGERGERERGEACARAGVLVQVDAAPVRGRALAEERAETDHAERDDRQRDRAAPAVARRARCRRRAGGRAGRAGSELSGRRPRTTQVRAHRDACRREPGRDAGGGEEPDAPEPVEAGHDRPPRARSTWTAWSFMATSTSPAAIPSGTSAIVRVASPPASAGPARQTAKSGSPTWTTRRLPNRSTSQAATRVPSEEPGREAGQRDAELSVAEPEVGLDRRDARGERPRDRRVDEEDGGGASTRAHRSARPGAATCGRRGRAGRPASRPG